MGLHRMRNAVIRTADIAINDHGFLVATLDLDYGTGERQVFGGQGLYISRSSSAFRLESFAGHFIYRIMEIADVTEWSHLPGKTIRVQSNNSSIGAIGHIVKDDWFDPKKDFLPIIEKIHAEQQAAKKDTFGEALGKAFLENSKLRKDPSEILIPCSIPPELCPPRSVFRVHGRNLQNAVGICSKTFDFIMFRKDGSLVTEIHGHLPGGTCYPITRIGDYEGAVNIESDDDCSAMLEAIKVFSNPHGD